MSIALNILDTIIENYNDAKAKYDRLRQELSKSDMTISDILHSLELESFSACEGYKFAKMLKVISQDRRYYKNEMEEMGVMVKEFNISELILLRQKLIKLENNQTNRKYTPRILSPNEEGSLLKIV